MVIEYKDNLAFFKEVCAVEEAETLLEWIHDHPQGEVDLKDCSHLHSAVLQVLMAAKLRIAQPPSVPFITQWVLPAIAADSQYASFGPAEDQKGNAR